MLRKVLAAVLLCLTVSLTATHAQAAGNLVDKHLKATEGKCVACHKETPPSAQPKEQVCYACHGDLKAIGNKPIAKGKVNPHLNHVEELYCKDCHHMHKPSQNYCSDCHDDKFLGFKVP